MITILLIVILATIIAGLALIVSGIAYVFWPVLLVLGIGLCIDIFMLVHALKRRE